MNCHGFNTLFSLAMMEQLNHRVAALWGRLLGLVGHNSNQAAKEAETPVELDHQPEPAPAPSPSLSTAPTPAPTSAPPTPPPPAYPTLYWVEAERS